LKGIIVQVSVSLGGLPKRPVADGVITPLGLQGDFHSQPHIHGGPEKALLLVAMETVEELKRRGYPIFAGALGENLTTQGLDPRQLRIGHQLRVGTALIELSRMRGPCRALDIYGPEIKNEVYDALVKSGDPRSPRWGMSGFYARVLREGLVRPADEVELVSALA
jgi:MOSC domain-containing protein YiiM